MRILPIGIANDLEPECDRGTACSEDAERSNEHQMLFSWKDLPHNSEPYRLIMRGQGKIGRKNDSVMYNCNLL